MSTFDNNDRSGPVEGTYIEIGRTILQLSKRQLLLIKESRTDEFLALMAKKQKFVNQFVAIVESMRPDATDRKVRSDMLTIAEEIRAIDEQTIQQLREVTGQMKQSLQSMTAATAAKQNYAKVRTQSTLDIDR